MTFDYCANGDCLDKTILGSLNKNPNDHGELINNIVD